jgi:hypothetical protein
MQPAVHELGNGFFGGGKLWGSGKWMDVGWFRVLSALVVCE